MNVGYELGNLIRGQVTARITPETWWTNMQQGWVWDLDDLTVNQIEHPYHGSNYFNTGRANGLNFYESSAITAFVGVFRRDELYIAERLDQYDTRRHRIWRSVPPRRMARAKHPRWWFKSGFDDCVS